MYQAKQLQETLTELLGKEIAQASNEEIYDALLSMVQEMAAQKESAESKKKLYLSFKMLCENMMRNRFCFMV